MVGLADTPRKRRGRKPGEKPRVYTDNDVLNATVMVEVNGGNVLKTSRELGIPLATLWTWVNGRKRASLLKLKEERKGDLAEALEELAWQVLESTPRKIEGASLKDATLSLAIAVDKMRLLRGQPTTITQHDNLSPEQHLEKLRELAERGRARRLELAGPGGDFAVPLPPEPVPEEIHGPQPDPGQQVS